MISSSVAVALGLGVAVGFGAGALCFRKPTAPLPNPMAAIGSAPGAKAATITEWEHGLKTDRVVATRYHGPTTGYTIGFVFPRNLAHGDRAELWDFMENHGGYVFQGGGYPGAALMVKFGGISDRESADGKLREVLPALDRVMADWSAGRKVEIARSKPKREWPDTDPPREGEFGGNLNVNGTQYRKQEVVPGRWQWVVDEKAMRWLEEREAKRRALFWALRSRVLSEEEMAEVTRQGRRLNVDLNVSYREDDKASELNAALLQQAKLRAVAQASEQGVPER